LGFEAGINFYAYVGNDPVNANDPSGEIAGLFGPLNMKGSLGDPDFARISNVGNAMALTGSSVVAAGPLMTGGLAVGGSAGSAALTGGRVLAPVLGRALTSPRVKGFAFSGSISAISAGLGSLATGGTLRQAAIATGVGFAAGGAGSLRTVTGLGANIMKGGAVGIGSNAITQTFEIGTDENKTFAASHGERSEGE